MPPCTSYHQIPTTVRMHNSDIDDQFQMQTIHTSVEEIDNQHSMCIYIYIHTRFQDEIDVKLLEK